MRNAGLGRRGERREARGERREARDERRETKVMMTMIGQRRHELAVHHRRLHTVLLVSGPRIPLLHSALVCCWFPAPGFLDRKSTRLNSSHANISYAVF